MAATAEWQGDRGSFLCPGSRTSAGLPPLPFLSKESSEFREGFRFPVSGFWKKTY
jgi:hypothetical protein